MAESRVVITADVEQAVREINRFRAEANSSMQQITVMGDKLAGVLQSLGLAIGVSQIVQLSDEYAKYTAQLRLATISTQEYTKAYADVKRIATAAQADLAGTGTLYARIANGTRELGIAQKQVADITETVNLSLRVSGATAAEAASAQLQLSQAFASGTLRGEEFNAVNEAAPRLMLALADGMGKPVGALKQMASDGLITSKIMADVLPKALERLRDEATQIQTIGGAFTVLKNNVMEFVGVQSNANGTVAVLSGSIQLLAENLTLVFGVIKTLTAVKIGLWVEAWIVGVYKQIAANSALLASSIASAETEVARVAAMGAQAAATEAGIVVARQEMMTRLAQANANILSARAAIEAATAAGAQSFAIRTLNMATNELAIAEARRSASLAELAILGQQQARVSAQITAATLAEKAAKDALTVANAGGAVAAGLASRALAFMGGPLGAIILALGLAATAWAKWGSSAEKSNKLVLETFDEAQKRIIDGLDKQIEKYENLIQLKNAGMTTKEAEKNLPVIKQLGAASNRLSDINNGAGEFKNKSNEDIFFARMKVMSDISELTKKMQDEEKKGAVVAQLTVKERVKALKDELATKQEKMAVELAGIADLKGKTSDYDMLVQRIRDKYADKSADGAAASAAKSDLVASLASIKYGIEIAKAMRSEGLAGVAEMNRQGLASDAQYYVAKYNDALAAGTDIAKVKDAEIAELADYNNRNAAEEAATQGKIDKIRAERNEALRASLVAADQLRTQYVYDSAAPARAAQAAADAQVDAVNKEVVALQAQYDAYGKLPAAITAAAIAKLQARAVALETNEGSEEEIANTNRLIVALQTKAALESKVSAQDTGSSVAKAKELLDILTAVDAATKSAASGMAESFGKVGAAIGGLTIALSGYAVQQQAIAAQLAATKADPKSGPEKIAQAEIAAARSSAQAKVKSYGDMAGAAKSFFKENTAGYKVLEGTEKAFRAYEMAMAVESMVKKIFFKEGEVAANLALNGVKLAGEATTTAASTGLAATEASAWGITAVVKALASLPFPLNLAAGAATLAAVVAIGAQMMGGIGGGGADTTAKDRQAAAGTGSVFGDSSAKSDSIARALELTSANSSIELTHTAGMLAALRNIENSIGSFASLLVRTTGITGATAADSRSFDSKALKVAGAAGGALGGAAIGTYLGMGFAAIGGPLGLALGAVIGGVLGGTFIGKALSSVFGGSQSVTDTGFTMARTSLAAVTAGGAKANQYTDVKTDGGWFSGDSHDTALKSLGADANGQFTRVISSLASGITEAGKLLGLGGSAFTDHLNQFVVDIGKISLKGLKGDEIQKALESVFSKLGDDMAQFAVGGLGQFQKVGEGYLETLTRIAVDYANLDSILASTGTTFGMTGMSSIAARERLIELTGGIDKLASQSTSFATNFLTQAEQLAPVQKYVTEQLAAMGLVGIDTRDKFKATVLGLANSGALATEAGAQQYAGLLALADAFAKTHAATEDLTKSEQAISDERKDLQTQLNELTMTSVQLLALQRAGISDSNKALFDQVQRLKEVAAAREKAQATLDSSRAAVTTAYNAESSALKTTLDRLRSFQNGILSFKDSLALGSLSTLTPAQKAAEAQRQYEATLAKAKMGDATAQGALQAAATAYLTADQIIKASSDAYAADAAKVQADLAALAAVTGEQVGAADMQLAALNASVVGINKLNETALSTHDAIVAFTRALAAGQSLGLSGLDGSHAGGLTNVPFDGYRAELHRDEVVVDAPAAAAMRRYFGGAPSQGGKTDALVSEIKALREEVKGLRADQAQQTGDLISTNYDATDRAAGKAADGAKDAAKTTIWAQQSKGVLA